METPTERALIEALKTKLRKRLREKLKLNLPEPNEKQSKMNIILGKEVLK